MKDADRVLYILRGAGPTSCSSVAKVARIDRERIYRAMCELRSAGKVERLGPGRWDLTEAGRGVADDDLLRQMRLFAPSREVAAIE